MKILPLNGGVRAISRTNDKVIGYQVLTKKCLACLSWRKKKGTNEYEIWNSSHNCSINHKGSAGSMGVQRAIAIFLQSIQQNGLCYKNYVGGGDSSSFLKVVENKQCGEDFVINKLECVVRIQKRLGNKLRLLRQSMKGKF